MPRFKEEIEYDQEDTTDEFSFDDEQESFDDEEYEDYEEEDNFSEEDISSTSTPVRLRIPSTTTPAKQLRPIMPKSKFEILQIRKPVEEVTFKRVNKPMTVEDKKEGIVS